LKNRPNKKKNREIHKWNEEQGLKKGKTMNTIQRKMSINESYKLDVKEQHLIDFSMNGKTMGNNNIWILVKSHRILSLND
jgi:hypothetical protein